MQYLNKNGLAHYNTELMKKVVQSTEIRSIQIVTEYPEQEEEGVLYLKVIE